MFKRLFWLAVGTIVGFSGSVWAQRRIKRQIERYLPEKVVQQAQVGAKTFAADVRTATKAGLSAMREREATLRDQFKPPAR